MMECANLVAREIPTVPINPSVGQDYAKLAVNLTMTVLMECYVILAILTCV